VKSRQQCFWTLDPPTSGPEAGNHLKAGGWNNYKAQLFALLTLVTIVLYYLLFPETSTSLSVFSSYLRGENKPGVVAHTYNSNYSGG
jgi:hypothetical protein